MHFLVIYDKWKSESGALAEVISEYLSKRGAHAQMYGGVIGHDIGDSSSTALILGGDGFIVKNAMQLAKMRVPLIGINFGTVGFLAAIETNNWEEEIEKILAGRYKIKQKGILKGILTMAEGGSKKFEAINEAAILRGVQKFICLTVEKDGSSVYENVGGDGIIIPSAIGSTAYSLAAGGPIFEMGIGITPHAPHKVNVKPLVLEESTHIRVICLGGSKVLPEEFSLEVDGHGIDGELDRTIIKPGDEILVRYGRTKVRFIEPEGFSFIHALQKKLGLSR